MLSQGNAENYPERDVIAEFPCMGVLDTLQPTLVARSYAQCIAHFSHVHAEYVYVMYKWYTWMWSTVYELTFSQRYTSLHSHTK